MKPEGAPKIKLFMEKVSGENKEATILWIVASF
jgi:hypothetical protein